MQHDFSLDNQPGAAFRGDLNDALQALVGQSSGDAAPAVTYPFMWWMDTTNWLLKQRNAGNTAWMTLAAVVDGELVLYSHGDALSKATQDEVNAGEDDTKFVTPLKLQGKTATAAEAQALTSLTKLLTPGRLADAFGGSNVSKTTNGYQILPGGIIMQWGRGGSELSDKQPVSFNIAFPNNPFFVTINDETANTSGQSSVGTMGVDPAFNADGFVVRHSDYGASAIGAFSWFSIGY